MKNMPVLDSKTAEAQGFRPLTTGYHLPQELTMLGKTLDDLRRGHINHCLVETSDGVAVWRSWRTATSGACTQNGAHCDQHLIRPAATFSPKRRRTNMSRLTTAATKGINS
jgi:hypothetical protein